MKCYTGPYTWTDALQQPKQRKIDVRYKKITLPVVLYGCDTWSLILMQEHGLRPFRNRVLRRILKPEKDEITGA
jgi:hypothetical protein